jgi:hypothetical protein
MEQESTDDNHECVVHESIDRVKHVCEPRARICEKTQSSGELRIDQNLTARLIRVINSSMLSMLKIVVTRPSISVCVRTKVFWLESINQ